MWRKRKPLLAALAYQTHGESWRLGAGADVDLHIQHRTRGAHVHRCVDEGVVYVSLVGGRGGERAMGLGKSGSNRRK